MRRTTAGPSTLEKGAMIATGTCHAPLAHLTQSWHPRPVQPSLSRVRPVVVPILASCAFTPLPPRITHPAPYMCTSAHYCAGMATTSDYVKTQAEKDQEAAAAAARAVAAEEVARSEDAYRNQGRNPEAVAVNQSMGIKVKAMFDCEAETDADLAFAVGDIIIVTSKGTNPCMRTR